MKKKITWTPTWIYCKQCDKTTKAIAMEFTKDGRLLVLPECQHEQYYSFKLGE